jgi:hypothetical protein
MAVLRLTWSMVLRVASLWKPDKPAVKPTRWSRTMKLGLSAPIDAEAEHAEATLRNAAELAKQGQNTVTRLSFRENAITAWVFHTFADEQASRAHLEGRATDATDRSGAKPARPCASDHDGGPGTAIYGATSARYVSLHPAANPFATHHVNTLNRELAFRACGSRPGAGQAAWNRGNVHWRSMPTPPMRVSSVDLVDGPTASNLYCGQHCTYEIAPEVPHDGFLADFLMRSIRIVRDQIRPTATHLHHERIRTQTGSCPSGADPRHACTTQKGR